MGTPGRTTVGVQVRGLTGRLQLQKQAHLRALGAHLTGRECNTACGIMMRADRHMLHGEPVQSYRLRRLPSGPVGLRSVRASDNFSSDKGCAGAASRCKQRS